MGEFHATYVRAAAASAAPNLGLPHPPPSPVRARDITALNTTINGLRAELEKERDQSKPELHLHIHAVQTVECGDNSKDTLLQISMTIENTGAHSIAKNLTASLQVGDTVTPAATMIGPSVDMRTTFPDGSFISFKRADYLPVKAYANPIQRGAGVVGWFQAMVRNIDPTTAWNKGTVTVKCFDVMQKVGFAAGPEAGSNEITHVIDDLTKYSAISGAKAREFLAALRGAEAPLFHGTARLIAALKRCATQKQVIYPQKARIR